MQRRKPKLSETIRKSKQRSEAERRSAKEIESALSELEMAISNAEARRAPTFLLEHSMLKERRRKVAS